jgi:hypothetical protein
MQFRQQTEFREDVGGAQVFLARSPFLGWLAHARDPVTGVTECAWGSTQDEAANRALGLLGVLSWPQ